MQITSYSEAAVKEIKKCPALFVVFSVIISAIIAFLIAFSENLIVKVGFALAFIIIEVISFCRYKSTYYAVSDELFIKKSGIVFRKTKTIPLDKIVMKSVFFVGKTAVFTLIRTSGSFSVIFGEF